MSGQVKLVFATGEGEEVAFARVIAPSGGTAEAYTSHYRIDGREVRWDAYNARLQSYGILVQARNFLVFQARSLSAEQATGHRCMASTASSSARLHHLCLRSCYLLARESEQACRATSSRLRPSRPRS